MKSIQQNAYGTGRHGLARDAILTLALTHLRSARQSRVIDCDRVSAAFYLGRVAAARRLIA